LLYQKYEKFNFFKDTYNNDINSLNKTCTLCMNSTTQLTGC